MRPFAIARDGVIKRDVIPSSIKSHARRTQNVLAASGESRTRLYPGPMARCPAGRLKILPPKTRRASRSDRSSLRWLVLLFLCTYRLAAQSSNVVQAEYFIDVDPGVGQATPIVVTSDTVINVSITVSGGGLATGFHYMFVRVLDSNGRWGITESRPFYVRDTLEETLGKAPPVNAAEYFIDNDPAVGLGTLLLAQDTVLTAFEASAANLSPGFHYFFARARNQNGVWGITESRPFYVRDTSEVLQPSASAVSGMEYFLDSDPGVGSATRRNVADTTLVALTVPSTGLSTGFHYLFARAINQAGTWGLTESRPFYVRTDTAVSGVPALIVRLEYFYNTDPGVGSATPIAVTQPADTFLANLTFATTGLDTGSHKLVVRALDSQQRWGISELRTFKVANLPVVGLAATTVSFGNVKLGQPKDSVIAVTNAGNDTLKVTNITSTSAVFSARPTSFIVLPAATFHDTLRFVPSALGSVNAKLLIASNAASSPDTISVSGYGVGVPTAQFSAKSIAFGNVKLGQSKDTTVTLTNSGTDTLKISAISVDNPIFTFLATALTIPPGQALKDTIRFKPTQLGIVSGRVFISSNAASGVDTIQVSGYGVGTAVAQYNTKMLSFGIVKIGQFKDTALTITNIGNDTLRITDITSLDTIFSARPRVIKLAPGGTTADTLRFKPAAVGSVAGRLLVFSNASSSPDTITVSGTGSPATGVGDFASTIPNEYSLSQNYPNPFNPSTVIRYGLPARSHVKLEIYNTLGQRVALLVDEEQEARFYERTWHATVATGLYFYRLEAVATDEPNKSFVQVRKMVLVK